MAVLLAYFGADASIRFSGFNPEDGRRLGAKRHYVVSNGIDDPCPALAGSREHRGATVRIHCESCSWRSCTSQKADGPRRVVRKAVRAGVPFQFEVMGQWQSEDYAAACTKAD